MGGWDTKGKNLDGGFYFSSLCFSYRRQSVAEAAAKVPVNLCVESHLDF
jgi:hypothetical protein